MTGAHVFEYAARTTAGEVVRGTLSAESPAAATLGLQRRDLFVTRLGPGRGRRLTAGPSVPKRELVGFFRALATLVKSGVSIRTGLTTSIARTADRTFREALRGVLSDVEHGASLSAAMARRPGEFSAVHVAMIGAGEAGGVLEEVLDRIADSLDREHVLRNRLRGALAYPAIVAVSAGALAIFVLTRVVPMFAETFARFGVPLPLPTRILLAISALAAAPQMWAVGLVLVAFGLAAFARYRAIPNGRAAIERWSIRLPLVGTIVRSAATARVTRMLGTLLGSGMGLVDALDVITPIAGLVYGETLREISDCLRKGQALAEPTARSGLFDPMTAALIGVGEDTGRLDAMLIAAASYLELEVETAVATLAACVEPILIVTLGGAVGLIVFSIFIPLYSLIGSIS